MIGYMPDHARKLNNLFMGASSKNELAVEGTTRTAGTADTTQKTFESANNSNSAKGSGVIGKPPRDNNNRPSVSATSSNSMAAFRFYHN